MNNVEIQEYLAQPQFDEANRTYFHNLISSSSATINFNDCRTNPILIFLEIVNFISQQGYPIKALNLANTKMGLLGAESVARLMATNTTIQILNLSHTDISQDGTIALAKALRTNNTLVYLLLSGVKCTSFGAEELASMLKDNTSLQYLGLQGGKIGSWGAAVIVKSLAHNNTLVKLDLDKTFCDALRSRNDELAEKILAAISSNTAIEEINLSYDSVYFDLWNKVESVLTANKLRKLN